MTRCVRPTSSEAVRIGRPPGSLSECTLRQAQPDLRVSEFLRIRLRRAARALACPSIDLRHDGCHDGAALAISCLPEQRMSDELTPYELFVLKGHQDRPRRESEV